MDNETILKLLHSFQNITFLKEICQNFNQFLRDPRLNGSSTSVPMSLFTPYNPYTRIFIAIFISKKCSALKIHDKYYLHDENLPRIMKCERNSLTYFLFDVNASTTYKSETNLTWQEISRSLLIEFVG